MLGTHTTAAARKWHYQPNITKNVCCQLEYNRTFCYYLECSRSVTTWMRHIMNMYEQRYQLTHVAEVTCYGLLHTTRNVSTYTHTQYKVLSSVCTISNTLWTCTYQITHQFVNTPMATLLIRIYHKTCYPFVRVINVCIPEDAYYQHAHHTTGKTSTTAYCKWHISTHTRQQKANIRNLRVPDIKKSMNHIHKIRHVDQLANTRTDMLPTCTYCEPAVAYNRSQL